MTNRRVIYAAHPSPVWITPPELVELARLVLGGVTTRAAPRERELAPDPITLDPATERDNPIGAQLFRTVERGAPDHRDWIETIGEQRGIGGVASLWLNPPYGRELPHWLAQLELAHAFAPELALTLASLALVPARPGARWYADATARADVVCEVSGRVRFWLRASTGELAPAPAPARWGSTLLYRGPERARAARLLRCVGSTRLVRRSPSSRELSPSSRAAAVDPRQLNLLPSSPSSSADSASNVLPFRRRTW